MPLKVLVLWGKELLIYSSVLLRRICVFGFFFFQQLFGLWGVLDVEFAHLLFAGDVWCLHQQVLRLLVHGEEDYFADVGFVGQQQRAADREPVERDLPRNEEQVTVLDGGGPAGADRLRLQRHPAARPANPAPGPGG